MANIYKKMKTNGVVKELNTPKMLYTEGIRRNYEKSLIVSPYQNLIPLNYLLCYNEPLQERGLGNELRKVAGYIRGSKESGILRKFPEKSLMYDIICQTGAGRHRTLSLFARHLAHRIKKYILLDEDVSLYEMQMWAIQYYRNEGAEGGIQENISGSFEGRGYKMFMAPYSLYLTNNEDFTPFIQAVVLPENYLYMKYDLLVNNRVDLSKVIVLVDERIAKTDFHIPAFRGWYLKRMRQLKETCCDVWKVPEGFIIENCFKRGAILRSTSIFERQQETEKIVEKFYEFIMRGNIVEGEPPRVLPPFEEPLDIGIHAHERAYTIGGIDPYNIEPPREMPLQNMHVGNPTVTGHVIVSDGDAWTWEIPAGTHAPPPVRILPEESGF